MNDDVSCVFIDDQTHDAIEEIANAEGDSIQFTTDQLLREHERVRNVIEKNLRYDEAVGKMKQKMPVSKVT